MEKFSIMEYKKYSKILIFDGSHALHRSISEPHLWEMRNQKGERTGGVFGTLKTIYKETKYYNYFPVVIFDGHLSKRRLNIFSNYKHYQDKQLLTESTEPQSEYAELQQEVIEKVCNVITVNEVTGQRVLLPRKFTQPSIMLDIGQFNVSPNYSGVIASRLGGDNNKNAAVYILNNGISTEEISCPLYDTIK